MPDKIHENPLKHVTLLNKILQKWLIVSKIQVLHKSLCTLSSGLMGVLDLRLSVFVLALGFGIPCLLLKKLFF